MVQLAIAEGDGGHFGRMAAAQPTLGFGAASRSASGRLVHAICELRRSRQQFFPRKLLGDGMWDVLLRLYAAHLDQHRLSISKLTRETGSAATTVLRWLAALDQSGLIERTDDPNDYRRVFVELSDSGADAMNRFFAASGTHAIFI
jgi:DNA-binding MarR family transcriptional regulator